MEIEIQTDTYEQASEILKKNNNKIKTISERILGIQNNLDSRLSSGQLRQYSNSTKSSQEKISLISTNLVSKQSEYENLEKYAKSEAGDVKYQGKPEEQNQFVIDELITTNSNISAAAATIDATGAITTQSVLDGYNNGSAVESVDEVASELTATGAEVAQKSETFWQKIGNFFKRTGAAIGNLVTGILQGIGEFVEAVVDTCALVIGGVCSIVTGLIDGFQAIRAKITGDDNWSSTTKALWNNGIMKFVQHTYVKDTFNSFHENTGFGKWLDNNAWNWAKSDGVGYKIADGIGYIAPIIVLTIVTFGAGGAAAGAGAAGGSAAGAAAGAGAAATTGASMTISSQALAAGGMAAFAGFGKNTEYAWNDGASALEGLGYGAAKGLWEGAEMTLGYGINSFTAGIGSGIGKQVIDSSAHVLMDAADAASGSLVDPLFQMIYNPNEQTMDEIMNIVNYDENGNQINNYTWDDLSFQEKYNALFKRNGGWATVGTNAAFGAAASALSEIPDITKAAISVGAAKKLATAADAATETNAVKDVTPPLSDELDSAAKGAGEKATSIRKLSVEELDEIVKRNDIDLSQYSLEQRIQILEKMATEKGMSLKELGAQKGTGGKISPELQTEADRLALVVRNKAELAEPAITEMMHKLEVDGAELTGLKYKLKGTDSLSRKILSDSMELETTLTEAADKIGDSVRYTLLIDESNYSRQVNDSLVQLINEGYTVRKIKNFWGDPIYQGINTSIISPDGVVFELQFHTASSFNTKENINHLYYEIARNNFTTQSEKDIANSIMKEYQSQVTVPEGIMGYRAVK